MKNKLFVVLATSLIILAVVMNLSLDKQKNSMNLKFADMEAYAGTRESSDSKKGYLESPEDCTVTERAICTIDLQWIFGCTIDFEYTLDFPGRRDDCTYTGGPTTCTPYACRKN